GDIAGIAVEVGALAGHADLEERLSEVVGPTGVGDEPVRGAMAGVNVRVDESGADELVPRVDLAIDRAVEAWADVNDAIVLEDDDRAAEERVASAGEADDPSTAY